MKIITISREFGSGGREVGKRLADELGFDYYDREIIDAVATKSSFDASYVEDMLEKGLPRTFPFSFGRTFSYPDSQQQNFTKILLAQQQFITETAKEGRDFVIVGRSADVILEDFHPLNIFVFADMQSKLERCRKRAPADEKLSDRELVKKIKAVDRGRAMSRDFISDGNGDWGDKSNYHLLINTTDRNIKKLVPSVARFAIDFFE